jgi:hypothetical protein
MGRRRKHAIEIDRLAHAQPLIVQPLAFSASSRETARTGWAKVQ